MKLFYSVSSRVSWGLASLFAILILGPRHGAFSAAREEKLPAGFAALVPLHAKLKAPQMGDWLDRHYEFGQTYQQYLRSFPVRADSSRTIYIQPLGRMDRRQCQIMELAGEFLGKYYQLPTKVLPEISLDGLPKQARRKQSDAADEQVLTGHLLDHVLKPALPKDAAVVIGFTTKDLWPGDGWNYVFGQASLTDRVGVWSICRYGNPAADDATYRLCLARTLKTAAHEMGHMFSMSHCIFHQCNMCGANSLREADSHPMEMCPQCLTKLCYATGAEPGKRFTELADFYQRIGMKDEQAFCEKSLRAWQRAQRTSTATPTTSKRERGVSHN